MIHFCFINYVCLVAVWTIPKWTLNIHCKNQTKQKLKKKNMQMLIQIEKKKYKKTNPNQKPHNQFTNTTTNHVNWIIHNDHTFENMQWNKKKHKTQMNEWKMIRFRDAIPAYHRTTPQRTYTFCYELTMHSSEYE